MAGKTPPPPTSERVAIAEAVAERLKGRAGGDRKSNQAGNISGLIDKGETRDLAAAKAGFGSGKTLEAAQAVIAEAVAERLKGRQLANLKQNRGGNISTSDDVGKTRDLAAAGSPPDEPPLLRTMRASASGPPFATCP